jgi:hypothetical protein
MKINLTTIKNLFTDVHTYAVFAMFLTGGIGAITQLITPSILPYVSGVLGILAIFIQQYGKTTVTTV